jgi:hypothetical protein
MTMIVDRRREKNVSKRKSLTLEEKIEILDKLEMGEKVTSIAELKNLNESSIRTLKKNSENIRKTVANGCPLGAKRVGRARKSIMIEMENALMFWFEDCVSKNIPISGCLIKERAIQTYNYLKTLDRFAMESRDHSFNASSGWLDKLKKRFSLHNIKFTGEQASADVEAAESFKKNIVNIISEGGYSADQIFNADETALYWKKLPTRTYTNNSQRRAKGLKLPKDRVTLLLCSNLSGSCMIKPMIINNSANPRAMKLVSKNNLPVFWRSNQKAWMTQFLFEDWFHNCFIPGVETLMRDKNIYFKVLLILDNASCHQIKLEHPNVKIVFLPPNCTSIIQPLDQGIISTFKMHYTKKAFQVIFSRLERSENRSLIEVWKEFSILDCVEIVNATCVEIKPSTLNACWKQLLPEMINKEQDNSTITSSASEIINIVSNGNDRNIFVSQKDVEDFVLKEEPLDIEEVFDLIEKSSEKKINNKIRKKSL